jgi:phage head maturation protease
VLELIRRGDVFGCSFAFSYAKDGVRDEKKNGQNYRTVIQMASIDDFSIVVDPAYLGTYVCTREFHAPDEEPAVDMSGKMAVEIAMFELENL